MKELLSLLLVNHRNILTQFIKFGIVGASNTAISYVTYALLVKISVSYFWANLVAFIVSVFNAFCWNNKYVFKPNENERNVWKVLGKTYLAYAFTGLLLNSLLLYFWIDIVQISKYLAPIISLVLTIPLNFMISKFWAFK